MTVICPNCKYLNPSFEGLCLHCGESLVGAQPLSASAKPPYLAQGQTLEEKVDALSEKMDYILTLLEERKIHEWAKDLEL